MWTCSTSFCLMRFPTMWLLDGSYTPWSISFDHFVSVVIHSFMWKCFMSSFVTAGWWVMQYPHIPQSASINYNTIDWSMNIAILVSCISFVFSFETMYGCLAQAVPGFATTLHHDQLFTLLLSIVFHPIHPHPISITLSRTSQSTVICNRYLPHWESYIII